MEPKAEEEFIPETIYQDEILIRFLFSKDFKSKKVTIDKVIEKDVYSDSRNVGVSLQRLLYCSENSCKVFAKTIQTNTMQSPSPMIYSGFIAFKKSDFEITISEHLKERAAFECIVEYSPLDEEGAPLPDKTKVKLTDKGNVAHSDLRYLNPANIESETPSVAQRLFSRKLYKKSRVFLDSDCENEHYIDGLINTAF